MESQNIEFSLSSQNLRDIPFDNYEQNFTFIVNGKEYFTSRVVADILSPYLRRCHFYDETFNQFEITNNELSNYDQYFTEFLHLVNFCSQTFDTTYQKYFSQYFYDIGNIEEYHKIKPFEETLTPKNVLKRLQSLSKYESKFKTQDSKYLNELFEYASSNFEELDKEELIELNEEIIESIITNKSIKINDEDSLFQIIMKLYSKDQIRYNFLFEFVLFENLSEKNIENFISVFDIEHITSGTWHSICNRLQQPIMKKEDNSNNKERYLNEEAEIKIKEFKVNESQEFRGIMRYLTEKSNGNIHDNGTINITSNSIYGYGYEPRNSVDYEKTNYYESKDDGDAFICFDFKDRLIQLQSYSIKTCDNEPNTFHLKNWVIEISKDGNNWTEIDRHENDSTMNKRFTTCTFNIEKSSDFARFIKLRQTGNSWYQYNNHNKFLFNYIEFYGKIKEP